METCICGKTFETAQQLRAHKLKCKAVRAAAQPAQSIPQPSVQSAQQPIQTYKALPPPIVQHLERTYGDWLRYMEIGQQWREDFGGYAMYVKVPKQFSTEYRTMEYLEYDNATRRATGKSHKTEIPDIRWKSLQDIPSAILWLDQVKQHIIDNAYNRGIRLPSTNTSLEETKMTYEEYHKAVAGKL